MAERATRRYVYLWRIRCAVPAVAPASIRASRTNDGRSAPILPAIFVSARAITMLPAARRTIAYLTAIASVLTACARPSRVRPSPVAVDLWIQHVHVVDPITGAIRRDRAIGIADGMIAAVLDACDVQSGGPIRVLDGGGAYAIPGLWDAHTHLLQGDSATAVRNAAVALSYGVTHVRDMGSSMPARNTFVAWLGTNHPPAPSMIGSGPTFWAFSLPYGDKAQQVIVLDSAATDAAVARAAAAGVDFIKVYAGFDSTRLASLIRAARRYTLPVEGHAQAGLTLAEQSAMGMRTVEHLDFGTLAECAPSADTYFERVVASRFRNSGESIPAISAEFAAAVDTRDCRRRLRRAARAGLILTPTLVASYLAAADGRRLLAQIPASQRDDCALYLRQFDGLTVAGSEALAASGRRLMRVVIDAAVPLLAGTDAPTFCAAPGESLLLELRYMAAGGVATLDVLRAATSLPARVFSAPHVGELSVGKSADLVLLRENPLLSASAYGDPVGVYTQGRWYDHAALGSLRGQSK